MKIICPHGFRILLSQMPQFRMDLGRAYTKKDDKGHLKPNIKDSFVLQFSKTNPGMIYKVGVLGPISLYTYSSLPEPELWVYENETADKFIKNYDSNEAELDIEKYLANLIWEVKNK